MAALRSTPVQRLIAERNMTVLAVITILVGALQAAAGAGIALFRRSPDILRLARTTASVSIPVFLLIGVVQPLAGRAATILGFGMPLVVLAVLSRHSRQTHDPRPI